MFPTVQRETVASLAYTSSYFTLCEVGSTNTLSRQEKRPSMGKIAVFDCGNTGRIECPDLVSTHDGQCVQWMQIDFFGGCCLVGAIMSVLRWRATSTGCKARHFLVLSQNNQGGSGFERGYVAAAGDSR